MISFSRYLLAHPLLLGLALAIASPRLPATAQPQPALRIVFEGNTGGVSSGGALRSLAQHLFQDAIDEGAEVEILASDFGALYDRGRYLLPVSDEERLSGVLAVLDGSDVERLASIDVPVLRDRYTVNLLDPYAHLADQEPSAALTALVEHEMGQSGRFADVVRETWRLSVVQNALGHRALLLESPDASRDRPLGPPGLDRDLWEVRFRYEFAFQWGEGQGARLLSVARRVGEGTRRMRWIDNRLDGPVPATFVSAGNSVEGRSWIEGQVLNLQRPTSLEALHAVGLDLLVPAQNELAGGVANLRAEASAIDLDLISANLYAEGGDVPLFQGSELRELGGLRVAFVGLSDPDVTDTLPPEVIAEIDVAPPVAALHAELERLRQAPGGPPDLVVLLAVVDGRTLDTVTSGVGGIDLVIGPGRAVPERDSDHRVSLPPGSAPSEVDVSARRPVLTARAGAEMVGSVDVYATGGVIDEVRLVRRVVDQDWEPLSPYIDRINALRHDLYTEGEDLLFPDLNAFVRDHPELVEVYVAYANVPPGMTAEDYLDRYPVLFSRGIWHHYLANTVRDWTETDVALVRVIQQPFLLSGPISAVLIGSAVGVLDEIVVYRVSGEDLVRLLEARGTLERYPGAMGSDDPPPAASGAAWDEPDGEYLVGGRPIDPGARYTIALTDQLAAQPAYAGLLGDYAARTSFTRDLAGRELDADEAGAPQSLHGLAVTDLRQRVAAHPDLGDAYVAALVPMLAYQGAALVPEFAFRIRALDFSIQQVSSRGSREGYQAVRNTRVTQPDAFALNYVGNLDWIFDLVPLVVTLSLESEYGQVEIEGDTSETADDLVGLFDLQLRVGDVDFARSVRPYVTVRYDTEFTPVESEDSAGDTVELDRESLIRNSAGVRFDFSEVFPELRVGAFAEIDLAADAVSSTYGTELVFRQQLDLGPVEQRLDVQGLYYIPSDDDTEEDLRFTLHARLSLGVPLLGNLRLASFVDTFVFQGTEPTNDEVGLSLIFGAGLTYRDIFRWAL